MNWLNYSIMSKALERIKEISVPDKGAWLDDAKWRNRNEAWLDRSAMIAIRILREIRRQKPINGMTQKMLADSMGVSPQYINKVVKGKENLTLETIASIENVLGILLVEVPSFASSQEIEGMDGSLFVVNKSNAKVIAMNDCSLTGGLAIFRESEADYIPSGTHGY